MKEPDSKTKIKSQFEEAALWKLGVSAFQLIWFLSFLYSPNMVCVDRSVTECDRFSFRRWLGITTSTKRAKRSWWRYPGCSWRCCWGRSSPRTASGWAVSRTPLRWVAPLFFLFVLRWRWTCGCRECLEVRRVPGRPSPSRCLNLEVNINNNKWNGKYASWTCRCQGFHVNDKSVFSFYSAGWRPQRNAALVK